MTVYDRWHLTHPPEGATPCRCSRGKAKLYPNPATHEKGKRWQVRWDVIDEETGKRKQPRKNFAKKEGKDPETCADAYDAKIQAEINSDSYIDPSAGARPFKDYAEEVIANRAVDTNTRRKMRGQMGKHVYPVIGEVELRVLSKRPSRIQALIASMERGRLSPASISIVMVYVSTVFNTALDDGLITRNPCKAASVDIPTVDRKEMAVWTARQVAAMREMLPDRYAAMADCGAGIGMRQGEIFALSPDDVEWLSPEPVVHIRRQIKIIAGGMVFDLPKYRKTREVRLTPRRKIALAEHMRRFPPVTVTLPWRTLDGKPTPARLFFATADGRPVYRDTFNPDVWKPALRAAGIEVSRANGMHALRHYFATTLLTEGESIEAVSRWLGHADATVTLRIYLHFMPSRSNARMAEIIDAAMEPAAEDAPSRLRSRP